MARLNMVATTAALFFLSLHIANAQSSAEAVADAVAQTVPLQRLTPATVSPQRDSVVNTRAEPAAAGEPRDATLAVIDTADDMVLASAGWSSDWTPTDSAAFAAYSTTGVCRLGVGGALLTFTRSPCSCRPHLRV